MYNKKIKEQELIRIEYDKKEKGLQKKEILYEKYDIEQINKCNNCNNKLTNILSIDLVLKHKESYNSLCKNCYRDYCISLQ